MRGFVNNREEQQEGSDERDRDRIMEEVSGARKETEENKRDSAVR
jgi:hypothetical protein